jgi:hypothetical protein
MNSHFHFLTVVELVTLQVFLHKPKQMIVRWDRGRTVVDGPDVPSETTATALMYFVHCVEFHCCTEVSHLVTDVQVFSCE